MTRGQLNDYDELCKSERAKKAASATADLEKACEELRQSRGGPQTDALYKFGKVVGELALLARAQDARIVDLEAELALARHAAEEQSVVIAELSSRLRALEGDGR